MNTINKIYKVALSIALACGVSSCGSDWLDVTPVDSVPAEEALKTSTDLYSARVGMYKMLKGTSDFVDYYGRQFFTYGEMRGEDMQYESNKGSNRAKFYYDMNFRTADDFSHSTGIWETPLIVIGRANRIINAEGLTDAEDAAADIEYYKNEAKVVRALATFDLTRVYGKPYMQDNGASLGAPVVTEALNYDDKLNRNTVAECYTQIEKDLKDAIESGALPSAADDLVPGYLNHWAAEAILCRVYLTKGDWTNCLKYAEDIINNSPYTLWTMAQYTNAWNSDNENHSKEMIFEFAISGSTDWTDREGYAYLLADKSKTGNAFNESGYGDMIVTKSFSDMMISDRDDVRNSILKPYGENPDAFDGRGVYVCKMPKVRYNNVPVLRLSEVYLNAAEAAFNAGDKGKAADYLNALIQNRTVDQSKQVSASDITAERIYIERRKELVGEGHRYFDALRRGETIVRYTDVNDRGWHDVLNSDAQVIDTWNSKKQLPLIPAYEVEANPNIQQNPTY